MITKNIESKYKISILWNLWNNFEDLLLGSEIASNFKKINNKYDEIYLWGSSRCPILPKKKYTQYLDDYIQIELPRKLNFNDKHLKIKAAYSVLKGFLLAIDKSIKLNLDYAIITNVDAWMLDSQKLINLLESKVVNENSISIRSYYGSGLFSKDINYFPYIDDHFIIVNIKKFNPNNLKKMTKIINKFPLFLNDGGIHYLLLNIFESCLDHNKLGIYNSGDFCLNHYGEKTYGTLIPLQYQSNTAFLHANCSQVEELHAIRAKFLMYHHLYNLKFCKKYCTKHLRDNLNYKIKFKSIFKKKKFTDILFVFTYKIYTMVVFFFFKNSFVYKILEKKLHHTMGWRVFNKYLNYLPVYYLGRR